MIRLTIQMRNNNRARSDIWVNRFICYCCSCKNFVMTWNMERNAKLQYFVEIMVNGWVLFSFPNFLIYFEFWSLFQSTRSFKSGLIFVSLKTFYWTLFVNQNYIYIFVWRWSDFLAGELKNQIRKLKFRTPYSTYDMFLAKKLKFSAHGFLSKYLTTFLAVTNTLNQEIIVAFNWGLLFVCAPNFSLTFKFPKAVTDITANPLSLAAPKL